MGLDFETTGLNINTLSVVEVGLVLWDTNLRAPVRLAGYLVDPGPVEWEPDAMKKNGLSPELCAQYGTAELPAVRQLLSWYKLTDTLVAHNGVAFDRPVLLRWAKKHGLECPDDRLWIDTNFDLDIPPRDSTRLKYMAADHGFLNPFPHRAAFDVMTTLKILDAYDINKVIKVARSPTVVLRAIVSFANNDKARALGFRAQYENGKFKMRSMTTKECYLERERAAAKAAGFDIEIISKK